MWGAGAQYRELIISIGSKLPRMLEAEIGAVGSAVRGGLTEKVENF